MSEELKDMLLLCTKGKTVIHGTQAIPRTEAIKSVLNDIPKVFLKFTHVPFTLHLSSSTMIVTGAHVS